MHANKKIPCYIIEPKNYEQLQLWSKWLQSRKAVFITEHLSPISILNCISVWYMCHIFHF